MASNNIIQTATGELLFSQDGKIYNLYKLPKNFVINGDLDISGLGLTKLPNLSTVTVTGNFNCANNNLTSLRGAPHDVGKNFNCHNNQLENLEHLPLHIGGGIDLSLNNLRSLHGTPEIVNGNFNCASNFLTALNNGPKIVKGNFDCSHNQIVSLVDGPQQVGQGTLRPWYDCAYNNLISLDGAPKSALHTFNCDGNLFDNDSVAPPHISKYESITGISGLEKNKMISNYYSRSLRRGIHTLVDKIQKQIEPIALRAKMTLETKTGTK